MNSANKILLLVGTLAFSVGICVAQPRRGGGGGGRGGGFGGGGYGGESYVSENARTPREVQPHSRDENGAVFEIPLWTNAPGFERDVFTFVRIKRDVDYNSTGGRWTTDTPDSDLNLSFRLQQLTALRSDPDGRYLRLTEPELASYPFIYMVEPGSLLLHNDEVIALRKYLLNGGFLWLDDFWGEYEWEGMAKELRKVFPTRNFIELSPDHPIYHCVFDIKSKAQVPNIRNGRAQEYDPSYPTWEKGGREVHHRAIFDDQGRMMVLATHNTDNGDGWEREGENHYYFTHFSERIAYPLAINVIFYTMTH